jgi:putative PEP-CTERM system TPR-repeat lipoprotein
VEVVLLKAQILSGQSELDESLKVLEGLLEESPGLFDAWMYKGEILFALERWNDALGAYDEALNLNALSLPALLRRSLLLIRSGDATRARKDVQVLQRNYPMVPEALVRAGMLSLSEGKYPEALDAGRAALAKDSEFSPAYLLVGLAQFAQGSYEQADEALQKVVSAAPGNVLARRALADTRMKMQQPSRAVEALEPLLNSDTVDPKIMALAASAYAAAGQPEQASVWFERAASEQPADPGMQAMRAIGRMHAGELNAGLDALQSAVEKLQGATRADEILLLSLLGKGDLDRAMELATKLESRDAGSPITFNLKGAVLLARGEQDEANSAFERALQIKPDFLPAAKNLAQLDIAANKPEKAVERLRSVAAASKGSADAYVALAKLEARLGRKEDALVSLRSAVSADPASSEARERFVAALIAMGKPEEAYEAALDAMTKLPKNPRILRAAAEAMRFSKRVNQASETIQKVLSVASASAATTLGVADFLDSLGQPAEAEKTVRRALEASPTDSSLQIGMVKLLLKQKRSDDALKFAQEVETLQPASPKGALLQGEALQADKRYEEALAAFERALKLQPGGQIAIKRFLARDAAGHGEEAFEELEQWSGQNDGDAFAHAALGDLYLAKRESSEAVKHYEKVVAGKSATVDLMNKLAWLYHELGDEKALQTAQAAYSAAPNSGMVADTLGWILVGSGDSVQGLDILKRAAALEPGDPEIRYHLAFALAKNDERDDARLELKNLLASRKEFESREKAATLLESLD